MFPTTLLLSFITFLLLLLNWVCICSISICICCILCNSWGNICVDWLVAFLIWNKVSSVSLSSGCNMSAKNSTHCSTICADWKPSPTTVLSAKSFNTWQTVPKCGLNSAQFLSTVSFRLHYWSPILYHPVLFIIFQAKFIYCWFV